MEGNSKIFVAIFQRGGAMREAKVNGQFFKTRNCVANVTSESEKMAEEEQQRTQQKMMQLQLQCLRSLLLLNACGVLEESFITIS
jgi:hypothetical protein